MVFYRRRISAFSPVRYMEAVSDRFSAKSARRNRRLRRRYFSRSLRRRLSGFDLCGLYGLVLKLSEN